MRTAAFCRLRSTSRWIVPRNQRPVSSSSVHHEHRSTAPGPADSHPSPGPARLPEEVILSGIQPTGVPHLGNYLGALRQWKDFHDARVNGETRDLLYYSVVDLHALTGNTRGAQLSQLRKESYAALLAIGLTPQNSALFFQSDIPGHAELMWILSTIASTGYLSRMTQWKSKLNLPADTELTSDVATQSLKLGLFSYPVLQAADILLYRASRVPVGEDQQQHIEFARTLARGFNAHFGPLPPSYAYPQGGSIFSPLPEALISPAKRIMSLRDPSVKMSKSHADSNSRILITDAPDEIHAKLKIAVTDSIEGITYDPSTRPGISNLIDILKHVTRTDLTQQEIAADHKDTSKKAFKELIGDEIVKALDGVRERFTELTQPGNREMRDARERGLKRAGTRAAVTMQRVRQVAGLGRSKNFDDGEVEEGRTRKGRKSREGGEKGQSQRHERGEE